MYLSRRNYERKKILGNDIFNKNKRDIISKYPLCSNKRISIKFKKDN